jgi:dTDP-4-amino-4,6-dideoxygalactose transaminase
MSIVFNKPYLTGQEIAYVAEALEQGHLSGDGSFSKRCHAWLEQHTGAKRALLTQSCTAALEMAALLLDLAPGDEVIMPSYTFVSTANAFVLRGAIPVFVDIRADTLNLDERQIEAAITPRTRAICVVHYAGVACEMDSILDIARRHGLSVVEDAAQAIYSTYKGRPLGAIGDYGCFSFHETKNIISGEGGALLIRDASTVERAEILREKGTNRTKFFRGIVDKYTWVDIGSSYLPSEQIAAFLYAQLEAGPDIIRRRLALWDRYHQWAERHERNGLLRRPVVPDDCQHNGHMYYLLLPNLEYRTRFMARMKEAGVNTVFHYIPLHSSPGGLKYGRSTPEKLPVTDLASGQLVRMPLWVELEQHLDDLLERTDKVLATL